MSKQAERNHLVLILGKISLFITHCDAEYQAAVIIYKTIEFVYFNTTSGYQWTLITVEYMVAYYYLESVLDFDRTSAELEQCGLAC